MNCRNYKVFDAHCDTLTYLIDEKKELDTSEGMIRADMLTKYGGYIQVFAAWIDQRKKKPLLEAITVADKFYKETARCKITPITDSKTLLRVAKSGGLGAIFAIEDGIALCGSLSVLNMLYRLGCRAITLTWNGENELGQGAVASDGGGLTEFGKSVVRKMNELGMAIDVSHLSERGFFDVMELTSKPIIASHSNAKAVCPHPRNLSDAQLRELIRTGGVTGINLYTAFVSGSGKAGVSDVVRHIEHILALGGENSIGIGTDYDGIPAAAEGLESADKLYMLFEELRRLNYSDALIEKISYGNFLRAFSDILG